MASDDSLIGPFIAVISCTYFSYKRDWANMLVVKLYMNGMCTKSEGSRGSVVYNGSHKGQLTVRCYKLTTAVTAAAT